MAYEPTVWNCGDTITADKLNKLEQGLSDCCGSSGGVMVLNVDHELLPTGSDECPNGGGKVTYSHSWQEIHDALLNGVLVVFSYQQGDGDLMLNLITWTSNADGYFAGSSMNPTTFTFADATSKVWIECNSGGET